MVVFEDNMSFVVLNKKVIIYGAETAHGNNVVVEYDNNFHYLGNKSATISTVVEFLSSINKPLSNSDIDSIVVENNLKNVNNASIENY